MTVVARRAQKRGFPISQGGFGGWIGDPAAIPPPSAFNIGTAGVVVNERTVLSLMVVASCVRVLGDTASGLEPRVYRMSGNRRSKQDKEVDPPDVIVSPYADMDREDGDFRRVASLGLNGNMMSHVVDRDDAGNPSCVEVINPSAIKVEMVAGRRVYRVGAAGVVIPSDDVIHVPWLSLAGGVVGLNPIEIGVNGFGIPLAAEQYAARYFAQGMHPTGILSVEKQLRPEDSKRIEQELLMKHGGLAQSHTPFVLDSAAKWQQISITPETAQLLQSREFARGEIAGFYGVPGHLIGETGDQGGPWGKGLQELVMGFALFSLSGYTRRLDRADTMLLPAGFYVQRRVSDIFKTNDEMLSKFVAALRMNAVATPNEAREMVGLSLSDEPGADSLFSPINSAHADFSAAGGWGPETGLPGSLNPKGVPNGSVDGGAPVADDVARSIASLSATVEARHRDELVELARAVAGRADADAEQTRMLVNEIRSGTTMQLDGFRDLLVGFREQQQTAEDLTRASTGRLVDAIRESRTPEATVKLEPVVEVTTPAPVVRVEPPDMSDLVDAFHSLAEATREAKPPVVNVEVPRPQKIRVTRNRKGEITGTEPLDE